ncbi:unnamed protein product [Schistocephalus solidus]|uniref:Uncharacterized protein n=1 Tax=Schistocephalus solidus TaxID=70667 RepID=A0A183T9W9_SCHSO|nr:unnamed protein product [Schistocephalus solidus]
MILNSAASRPSMLSKVECDTHRSVNVEDDADDEDSPSAFLTELPSGISQCLNSPRSQISTSRTVDLTDKEDVIAKDTSALTRTTKESLSSVTPESWSERKPQVVEAEENSVRADFSEEIEDCRLVDLESEGLEKRTPTPKSPFLTNSSSSRIRSHSNKLVPWNQLVTPHPSVISDSSGDANRTENTRPPVRGADGASQTVGRRQRPEAGTIPPIRESVSPLVRDRIRLMETTKRRVRQRTALVCRRQVQQQQDIAPPPQRMLQRSWTELQFQPTHWPLGPKAASVDVGKQSLDLNFPVVWHIT